MFKVSVPIEYPCSYKINLFLHQDQVFSIVSSDQFSCFTSKVFGMTVKDFTELSTIPSFWLLRIFQVDFKRKFVTFARGLRGGGPNLTRERLQVINIGRKEEIKELVEDIKKGLEMGEVAKDRTRRLKEVGYFSYDNPAWIFETLYSSFIKENFLNNQNLVKERQKVARLLRKFLHISSLPIYPESERKSLMKNFKNNDLKNKIKSLKDLSKVEEYPTIVELQVIQKLTINSGKHWWQKLHKECIILFNTFVGIENTDDSMETRYNHLINMIKTMKKSYKSLPACLDHLLNPGLYTNEQLELITEELIKYLKTSVDQQFGVIILFLVKIMKKQILNLEIINKIFQHFDIQTLQYFSRDRILGVMFMIEKLKKVDKNITGHLNRVLESLDRVNSITQNIRTTFRLSYFQRSEVLNQFYLERSNIRINFFNQLLFGREQELEKMKKLLISDFGNHGFSNILTIYGERGIGKSDLAYEFAHMNKDHYRFIFIIDASSNETVDSDMHYCFYHIINSENKENFKSISDYFHTCEEKLLLIIDDYQGFESLRSLYVMNPNIHFIITCENLFNISREYGKAIHLQGLDSRNSYSMMKNLLSIKIENTPLNQILNNNANSPSFIRLLSIFSNFKKIELSALQLNQIEDEFIHSSIKRICSEADQVFILKILKLLFSETVREKLIEDIYLSYFTKAIAWKLSKYYLLSTLLVKEENDFWLIDRFILDKLPFKPDSELKKLVVLKLTELNLDVFNTSNWEIGFSYYKHALHLIKLDETDFFCNTFLEIFIVSFQFNILKLPIQDPANFFNKFQEIIENDYFTNDEKVLIITRISQLSINFKFFRTAKNYLEMIFNIITLDTFTDPKIQQFFYFNLAISCMKLSFFNEANIYFQRYSKLSNPINFRDELYFMYLGEFETECNRLENSENSLKQALEFAKLKPKNELKLASILLRTAKLKLEQKSYQECRKLLKESIKNIKICKDFINPEYAEILQTTGILYFNEEKMKKSEKKLEESLEIQKKIFGLNHPGQGKVNFYLGKIHSRQNNIEKAEDYYKLINQASYINEYNCGEDEFLFEAGLNSFKRFKIDESFEKFSQLISSTRQNFQVSQAWLYIGKIQFIRSDYLSAINSFEKSLEILTGLNHDPVERFKVMLEFSKCFTIIGRFDESENCLNQIFVYLNNSDSDLVFKVSAYIEYGYLYFSKMALDRALNIFWECFSFIEKINNGSNDLLISLFHLRRGENYLLLNMNNECFNDLERCLMIRTAYLPSDHSEIADIHLVLGRYYLKTENYDKAENELSSCYNIRRSAEVNLETLKIYLELGNLYLLKSSKIKRDLMLNNQAIQLFHQFYNYSKEYFDYFRSYWRKEFDNLYLLMAKMAKSYGDLKFLDDNTLSSIQHYQYYLSIIDNMQGYELERSKAYAKLAKFYKITKNQNERERCLVECFKIIELNLVLLGNSFIRICKKIIKLYDAYEELNGNIDFYRMKLQQFQADMNN